MTVVPDDANLTKKALDQVLSYAKDNYMKINQSKSKIILFNPTRRNMDFLPKIELNKEILEVTDKMRLVGLILSDDLTWTANTDSMVKRAYAKLWILRRLKQMGTESNILKLIYFRHVRSILEFGVPVWNGAITKKEVSKIERVQKIAIHIIYGKQCSYKQSCKKFKIDKLMIRREKLCKNLAKKHSNLTNLENGS